jgi:hypothetical protein
MSSVPNNDYASILQSQLPYIVAASAVAVGLLYLMSNGSSQVTQKGSDHYSTAQGANTSTSA